MTKHTGKNKRKGSSWVQTKRSSKNEHAWETAVGYAKRKQEKQKAQRIICADRSARTRQTRKGR